MGSVSVAVGTIVTKSHLPYARTLAGSIHALHPGVPVHVLLADTVDGYFEPADESFELIPLEAMAVRNLRALCFWYPRLQLTIALKPQLLRYLLDRGYEAAVFMDADILAVSGLDPLFHAAREHAVVLTPHLLSAPTGLRRFSRELDILRAGVYNGGCVSVSQRRGGHAFLAWWEDRLTTHCRYAIAEGMHYDQRWLDLSPGLFDDVHVLADEGCNVAYWNLPERDLTACRFFHFSGFNPDQPTAVTRHFPYPTMDDIGSARQLFERYVVLLHQQGLETAKQWPYGYECFDNGVPIPALARETYLDMGAQSAAFADPFSTGAGSFFEWLTNLRPLPAPVLGAYNPNRADR